jgi:hypothetical protein
MLDIKALEAAFARIGEIGRGEIDVDLDGVRVCMRSLTPEEDVEVQRHARGENIDDLDNITLIERFKRATLGYAIVQVGTLNLRGVTSIPTGEVLQNGTPVRVPKHEAVRRIADGWSRHATTLLFQQYAELVKRVEDDANARVKYDGAKLDAEIERLESRLDDLRRMKIATVKVDTAPVLESLIDAEATLSQTAIHPVPAPEPAPEPAPRQRMVPEKAPPILRAAPMAEAPTPAAVQAPVRSSIGDFTLEDVAAEEARIQEARARRMRPPSSDNEPLPEPPTPVPVPQRRTPPHLAARPPVEEVGGALDDVVAEGPVNGVEAFRIPSMAVTDRGRPNVPPAPTRGGPPGQRPTPMNVNPSPSTGPNNPNFRKGPGR